ncbi:hypothetical protein N7466_002962 [Penicillium verhagenii]|uniref:uncharacterized protein n=1 Tax=Penicillium verhagenii TaxID=1562060 RepID=UPI0025455F29|nr:uncharacterized protein N7466_002962 [Penicillium verhagenii]KAJ5939828.1 hypothetical protein N7466_002962 [Penicillium verhagenii]
MDTTGPSNIWGARTNASDSWSFDIYEDPDKENIFATGSDYDSPVRPEPEPENDLARLATRQQDAFGVLPYSQALIDIAFREDGVLSHPASDSPSVPTPTETLRPAMRIEVREEEEIDSGEGFIDLEDTLESGQIREIQHLSDVFVRGVEDRMVHGRHYPMRDDGNIQGPANVFMEARRITHYQRHQSRRANFEADE